jgi:spermidine synthase
VTPGRSTSLLPWIFVLFLLSGATSLVYEVVWLRQLILVFGSTQFATSTILSTFMGGLALGAFLAGRWMDGRRLRPLRVYGWLEIGIGIYALCVPYLFDSLSPIYRAVWQAGASESFVALSLAKFVGIAFVLLPPTVLMGASLPVLARQIADDPERIGGTVGRLYAINIFGAVAGVFVAGFIAIPGAGVQRTVWATALANVLIGSAAVWLAGRTGPVQVTAEPRPITGDSGATPAKIRLVLLAFGLSGFGALVLEVAWTRVLALVMGSSVYAFSLMLLAFLIGLAVGGAFFSAYLRRRPSTDPTILLVLLLGAVGVLAYATSFLFQLLPRFFSEIHFAWQPGPNVWFAIQLAFGLLIMFPATFALGGIFPAVLQIHARDLERVPMSVGTVYASNTVGTIVGAALAGFVLIPQFGVLSTVLGIAAVEMLLGVLVALLVVARSGRLRVALALPLLAGVLLVLVVRPSWDVRLMNSGVYMNLYGRDLENGWEGFLETIHENNEVVYAAEGLTASVFVADQPDFDNRYLAVNGKIEASTQSDLETQLMAAHLPLLLHEDPRDVLVIGLASAITVGSAATHPVETILVVEVEKAMEPAARLFAEANNGVLDDRRVELSFNDARNELDFSSRTYDAIISEPSNPWMTVAANLFTEDFFRMARTRLRTEGVFCQWIQNYFLPFEDLRSIIAAFRVSFPHVMLFETYDGVDLLLVGSEQPIGFDLERLESRMSELNVRMDLGRVDIRSPIDMLGLYRLGPADVDRLVDGAPRNTDDNARVEFSAPKHFGFYSVDENQARLGSYSGDPLERVVPPITNADERDRLRIQLARSLFAQGSLELAAESARMAADGPRRAEAERILTAVESAADEP